MSSQDSGQDRAASRKNAIAKAVASARAGKRKSQSLDGKAEGMSDVQSIVEGIKAKRMALGGMVEASEDEDFLTSEMDLADAEEQLALDERPLQDPEHEIEGTGDKRKKMISAALSKAHSK